MAELDRREIAARIRALVTDQSVTGLKAMAARLGVSEPAFRASIDEALPDPALEVLVAVVRDLGVDPTWLLTGEYAAATHERALDCDNVEVVSLLKELMRRDSSMGSVLPASELIPDFTAEMRAAGSDADPSN